MSKLPTDPLSVTTVAVDLAKHVFQVHDCGASGKAIVGKALRRKDMLSVVASLGPCRIGMVVWDYGDYGDRTTATVHLSIIRRTQSAVVQY